MRRALVGSLIVLMLLGTSASAVTATGRGNTYLGHCTNPATNYHGGIKVYAGDRGTGASRVMCVPALRVRGTHTQRTGVRTDLNLNRRNVKRRQLEDIWRGFHRNIESFRLRAAPGCVTEAALLGARGKVLLVRHVDNIVGTTPKTAFFEIFRRKDNAAVAVVVAVGCSEHFPLYATGDIRCNGAEDKVAPVGRAHLLPVRRGIAWVVVLEGAAANWDYYVEFNQKTAECQDVRGTFEGFTTDANGDGVFRGFLRLPPGRYRLNPNIVSNPANNVPPNPRHREMSGFDYVTIRVR